MPTYDAIADMDGHGIKRNPLMEGRRVRIVRNPWGGLVEFAEFAEGTEHTVVAYYAGVPFPIYLRDADGQAFPFALSEVEFLD